MITEKEIIEALRKGENITDIGNNIAKILNSANETFQKEEEQKRAATLKQEDLTNIIESLIEWYNIWYGKKININAEEIAKETIDALENFDSIMQVFNSIPKFDNKTYKKVGKNDFEELVKSFLS